MLVAGTDLAVDVVVHVARLERAGWFVVVRSSSRSDYTFSALWTFGIDAYYWDEAG